MCLARASGPIAAARLHPTNSTWTSSKKAQPLYHPARQGCFGRCRAKLLAVPDDRLPLLFGERGYQRGCQGSHQLPLLFGQWSHHRCHQLPLLFGDPSHSTGSFELELAIWAVAVLTGVSGLVVAVRMYETHRVPPDAARPTPPSVTARA